jgi:CRISPR-associated exonuclease Cas4
MYSDDELLPLSGLQHISFCERRWALIHLEQHWDENWLTAEGRIMHERAHEQTEDSRKDLLIVRGLPVRSSRLGVSGRADVVEFSRVSMTPTAGAIELGDRQGWWRPRPVEYKRGRGDSKHSDSVQLCAQALCVEEMLGTVIEEGALFYGTPKRRVLVRFDATLRADTERLAMRMHELFRAKRTPRAVPIPGCVSCSLKEACMPELGRKRSVAAYQAAVVAGE